MNIYYVLRYWVDLFGEVTTYVTLDLTNIVNCHYHICSVLHSFASATISTVTEQQELLFGFSTYSYSGAILAHASIQDDGEVVEHGEHKASNDSQDGEDVQLHAKHRQLWTEAEGRHQHKVIWLLHGVGWDVGWISMPNPKPWTLTDWTTVHDSTSRLVGSCLLQVKSGLNQPICLFLEAAE